MQWFNNLKIPTKLVINFLVIIGLMVIIGLVGLTGMRQIDSAAYYVTRNSRSLFYLSRVQETLQSARISVRDMVIGGIVDERSKIETSFAKIAEDMAIIGIYFDGFSAMDINADIQNAFAAGRLLYENELITIIQGIYIASIAGDVSRAFALLDKCVTVSNAILAYFDKSMGLGLRYSEGVNADAYDTMNSQQLDGAEFDFYAAVLESSSIPSFASDHRIDIGDLTFYYLMSGTDRFDSIWLTPTHNLVFMLVETAVPEGFVLPTGNDARSFFILAGSPAILDDVNLALGVGVEAEAIADNITVFNTPESSTNPTLPQEPGLPEEPILPGGLTLPEEPTAPPIVAETNTLVARYNDGWIEINEFGTPLGEWNWDDDDEVWIFEPTVPLAAFGELDMPKTGETPLTHILFLLGSVLLAAGALVQVSKLKRISDNSNLRH